MKKYFSLLPALMVGCALFAAEPQKVEEKKPQVNVEKDLPKISKAFGHIIGQNLTSLGLDFDMKEVIQGIQDCVNGVPSPMNESECIQAITAIQENAFQKQSLDNLKKAEEFLTKNKNAEGVIELEAGKLQYVRLKEGTGELVQSHFSPVVRYTGKFIDGKTFGESREDEVISLDETIVGFNKAITGMKEGEKRRIFIHPDLGYGTNGFLPPNSLLTFEIEVVKANAPKSEDKTVTSSEADDDHNDEIAIVDKAATGIR